MNYRQLTIANVFIFAFYAIFFYLGKNIGFFEIPRIFFSITVILISGLNSAALLNIITKKNFDIWEIINFSFLGILILYPLILSLEFIFLKRVYQFLPIMNFFAVFLILFLTAWRNKVDWKTNFVQIAKTKTREILTSPLLIALIINTAVIVAIFSAYEFLPDKDPFKWLFRLSDLFNANSLSPVTYRPFFSGITYIFTQITGMDIFYFFKYIIPFFSLSIVFSLWLFARNIRDKNAQIILLLLSLITSNVILYSQTAMPQVFAIFLAYYFIAFLLYYHQNKDFFYYCIAGATSFFAIFFHELSAIFFFVWLAITLIFFRKKLLLEKKDVIYIIIIILSNISILKFDFLFSWVRKIALMAKDLRINLLFPAHYMNIEGNAMGWKSSLGILKFYSYYVGPLLFLIFFLFIFYLLKSKDFEEYFKDKLKNKEISILLVCFFIFFSISEILPRAINFSFLPDRSWVFGGIFSLIFIFLLFDFFQKLKISPSRIYLLIFIFLAVNISGAIYINYQKRFLITKNEMDSAKWIKGNLPSNRVIASSSQTSVIKYYSNSTLLPISINFYYSENSVAKFVNKNNVIPANSFDFSAYVESVNQNANTLNSLFEENQDNLFTKTKDFSNIATSNIAASKIILNKISTAKNVLSGNLDNLYIYYSEKSNENPYKERPYELDKNNIVNNFIFDQYPDKFQRIYEKDGDGRVIIWKVL